MRIKVRAILKMLHKDGWIIDRVKGSHRQLVHPIKKGIVTLSGHPNDDLHPKTVKSVLDQAGIEE
jgi:predicted RNA binding protein YcfA (HicA-like mRNA interferase family)